jgi:hypothetical protein
MKSLHKFLYITILALAFSCNESEDLVTDNAREGGLLDPASTSVNYVVGQPEGPYTMSFLVRQSDVKTTQVNIYKSFTSTVKYTEIVDGKEVEKSKTFTSNEVLAESIDITDMKNHHISSSYDFNKLTQGLQVESLTGGPGPLPASDGDYQIGDKWLFRVESVLDDGRVVQQAAPISVAVSTRYAGTYKPVAGSYFRLGVPTTDLSGWPDKVLIESVDATTYRILEYWGPFEANEVLFQIIDGKIIYVPDQVFNDQPMITCESNPGDFVPAVNCGNTNYVINDDLTGKDRLVMTSGYYTGGSGPRVFYQILEKVN